MERVKSGDTVLMHFIGRLDDGTVFDDSREEEEPLEVKVGDEELLPAFEHELIGLARGEKKTFSISSEEAYGPYDDELVLTVDREQLPEELEPELGQLLEITVDDNEFEVVVTGVTEDKVLLDANHPLSGHDLTFEVEILEIHSGE
ncbi:peptidylprolyl isomerase [bacterium]|nr:peptidylprolyl isomerase [candidate division CSSED10-310 bacterium]